ncbi:hypothetical protein ACFO0N_17770 [Halobium salinum]|uniref:DUF7344 domain-containing protein n=1 Tax=Halobium salinum TaxID=1364940 RepID=A0ABD5PH70_9EURY|nr:hypothetical protein [Halobium salinum]
MTDEPTVSAGSGRNVLALTPAVDADSPERHLDRWVTERDALPTAVVSVTYTGCPDEWVRAVAGDAERTHRTLVRVGDFARSAAHAGAETLTETAGPSGDGSRITVSTVPDPTALDDLLAALERCLDRSTAAGPSADGSPADRSSVHDSPSGDPVADRTALVFDSVNDLLERVPLDQAGRFLADLVEVVDRTGAEAYYAFDPGDHEPATVATLLTAFDAVELVPPRDEPTRESDPEPETADAPTVEPERVHDVLRSERRRRMLYRLLAHPEGIEVRALADDLAAATDADGEESETTDEVRVGLAHVDLPKLEGEGFIERREGGYLTATPAARSLLPYLRIDAVADGVDLDELGVDTSD